MHISRLRFVQQMCQSGSGCRLTPRFTLHYCGLLTSKSRKLRLLPAARVRHRSGSFFSNGKRSCRLRMRIRWMRRFRNSACRSVSACRSICASTRSWSRGKCGSRVVRRKGLRLRSTAAVWKRFYKESIFRPLRRTM